MNVVFRQDATNDADAILCADLANDLSYSLSNVPAQNIKTALHRPDDVKGSVAKFLLAARATPVQISPTRVSACEAPP